MNMKKKVAAIVSSAPAKAAAAVGSLVASGAALASGGGASPGSAIAGELGTGKADVMLVVGACALILGAIILWRYVRKVG